MQHLFSRIGPVGIRFKRCLILLGLLGASAPAAPAQTLTWQQALSGNNNQPTGGNSSGEASAPDASGNIFVTGSFSGQVTFGNTRLVSAGGNDMFVAKWSTATNSWAWAFRDGGTDYETPRGIAASGGVVYVTGSFQGSTALAGATMTAVGPSDMFLAAYTDGGSSATPAWAVRGGGASTDSGWGVAVGSGGVYVTGVFDTAAGGASFAGTALTGAGSGDLFVAKYTLAGTNGWAVRGGSTGYDQGQGIATGASNGVYVTGYFTTAAGVTIAGAALTGAGGGDAFLAKYTDTGAGATNNWARREGGTGADYGYDIAVSGANVFLSGAYQNSGTTIAGVSLTNAGGMDLFVAKYADAGSAATPTWVVRGGGTGSDYGQALALGGTGVYVTGSFDSGTNTVIAGTTLTGVEQQDLYVAKFTDNGGTATANWAQSAGGYSGDYGLSMAVSSTGGVFSYGRTGQSTAMYGTAPQRPAPIYSAVLGQLDPTTGAWLRLGVPLNGGKSAVTATAVNTAGDVFVTGFFSGTVGFGTTVLTSVGSTTDRDIFVAKWNATTSTWDWAERGGGLGSDYGYGIATNGTSVYVTGSFSTLGYIPGTASTIPSATQIAGVSLAGAGGSDTFVAKYVDNGSSATGTWAVRGGGTNDDSGMAIAVSGTGLFVTGSFSGPATIAGATLTSAGLADVFVAKYTDAGASATNRWARAGGAAAGSGRAIAVNGTEVFVTGNFQGPATLGGGSQAGFGFDDIFVAKYADNTTSAGNGWGVQSGGTQNDQGTGIAVSGSSVYVTGYFDRGGAATIGGVSQPNPGFNVTNAFLVKYTSGASSAAVNWVRTDGGGQTAVARAVALSGSEVYVGGEVSGTNVPIAGNTFSTNSSREVYVARYTDAGNSVGAGGALSGAQGNFATAFGSGLAISGGNIYLAGSVEPSATFGSTTLNNPAGAQTNFLARAALVPAPTLTSFGPTADGPLGATINLNGTGLTGATTVTFSGSSNNTVSGPFQVNAAGTQLINLVVPSGAITGPVTITTPAGTSNGLTFTIIRDLVISSATQTPVSGSYRNITITGPTTGGAGAAEIVAPIQVTGAFVVQAGGRVDFLNTNNLTGPGSFELQAGAVLQLRQGGIFTTANSGSVQTATRTFASNATYEFGNNNIGIQTGDALPATVQTLIISGTTPNPVRLSQPVAIGRELRLSSGVFNLDGQMLTLLSTATETAQINQNGTTTTGTVTGGSATVQRYVSGDLNAGLGYRHFAAPVNGSTVADLAVSGGYQPVVNSSYNGSPTPGTVTLFPTVFGYDQARLATATSNLGAFDKGWFSPATLAAPLTSGFGYTVNLAAGQTVDFVGTLVQSGLAPNLVRNAAGTPNAADAGWQLLGNPYASAYDLSSLNGTADMDDAKYVFESTGQYAGQYRSYVNGVGNSLVALGQGFFGRLSAGATGATPTFSLAGRRVDFTANTTFRRDAPETRPMVELALRSATGRRDLTTLYEQAGATAGLDGTFDALKLANSTGLNLAQEAAGEQLAIQGLPLLSGTVVPLIVQVPAAGTYALEVARLLNLPAGTQAVLVDNLTGQRLDLRTLPATGYAFQAAAAQTFAGRFYLNLSAAGPLATATGLAAQVSVYPNPAHASCTVLVPAVVGAARVQAFLLNALGQRVRQQAATLPATGASLQLDLSGLAAGVYTLRLEAGSQVVTKRVVVE